MASTREIKQRIKNISSVQQLIDAMHMVATSQLRRVNRQLDGAIPVQEALSRKIWELGRLEEMEDHPYFEQRPVRSSLYLVLTGDRGMAGGYNNKVQNFALEQMEGKNEKILVVGSKGKRFFEKNGKNIIRSIVDLADSQIYYGSESLAQSLLDYFIQGEADEVFLIYTEFENVLSSSPRIEKLLPLDLTEDDPAYEIYEPGLLTYVENLVPFYLHMYVFRAFSEAHTSEQAARMLAMDTAGTNAGDLVEELQASLNRRRQTEITEELSEIIGQRQ